MADLETEKKAAATEALKHVTNGMIVGIGTGSTVAYFIDGLSEMVSNGLEITGVPTSKESERKAKEHGIPVTTSLERKIDITFDGADEADDCGNLIKGGGGALLREKIIAYNSRSMYVMVDSSKLKSRDQFGSFPLPVEVVPFLEERTKSNIESLGVKCTFRRDREFVTDNGNYILDCHFGKIEHPGDLESRIKMIPGVVEVGLFCKYADRIFEGKSDGCIVHDMRD